MEGVTIDFVPLIARILRGAPAPLGAEEIAHKMAEGDLGITVAAPVVLAALCGGPFDREISAGAPVWRNPGERPTQHCFCAQEDYR